MSIQDQDKLIRDLLKENPDATIGDYTPFLKEVEQSIERVRRASVIGMEDAKAIERIFEAHRNVPFY